MGTKTSSEPIPYKKLRFHLRSFGVFILCPYSLFKPLRMTAFILSSNT